MQLQNIICLKTSLLTHYIGNVYLFKLISLIIMLLIIVVLCTVTYYITKIFVIKLLRRVFGHSRLIFLQILSKNSVLNLFAPLLSSLIFLSGVTVIKSSHCAPAVILFIFHYLAFFCVVFTVLFMVSRIIWSLNEYYEHRFNCSNQYPIDNYIKVLILFFWVISLLSIFATLAHTSLVAIFTGISAVSAVFLLVFKDTLLGIVACIQVTASGAIRNGDRIIIDKYGVDGTVIDISITRVKVQNGDNTTITIPTYNIISDVVKNWRGVSESGARRIKRPINIDINSIKECTPEILDGIKHMPFIIKYLDINQGQEIINLALYREYLINYLNNNPKINHKFTTLVRHLDSNSKGLPLEIYTFTKNVTWLEYEETQSEIFEHFFAALPKFGLKVMQDNPVSI